MHIVEVAQLITAIATLIGVIGGVAVSVRNGRIGASNSQKLDEVHKTTNGLSERNEAIARKLGVEEGKAEERANPT